MLRSVQGIYHDGKIELVEPAPDGAEGRVIVTFLSLADVDLGKLVIAPAHAADLLTRLSTFAEDWNDPAMDRHDAL